MWVILAKFCSQNLKEEFRKVSFLCEGGSCEKMRAPDWLITSIIMQFGACPTSSATHCPYSRDYKQRVSWLITFVSESQVSMAIQPCITLLEELSWCLADTDLGFTQWAHQVNCTLYTILPAGGIFYRLCPPMRWVLHNSDPIYRQLLTAVGKKNNLLCFLMSFLALLATMFPQECAKNQHLCSRVLVKKCRKIDCLK